MKRFLAILLMLIIFLLCISCGVSDDVDNNPKARANPSSGTNPDTQVNPGSGANPDAQVNPEARVNPGSGVDSNTQAGTGSEVNSNAQTNPEAQVNLDTQADPSSGANPEAQVNPVARANPGSGVDSNPPVNPVFRANPGSGANPNSSVNPAARVNSSDDPPNSIYVSTDGNDAKATGAADAPYKSINAALSSAQPGDTIILRDGIYREGENVRIRTPNITIKSKQGEWAIIDLTNYNSGNDEDSAVYFDVDSSGGGLQGLEVMGGFYAVCMETKWDWGDPADRAGASDIIIEDCVLHNSRYDTIKVKPNCNNITIRNNEIYNSGMAFAGNVPNGEDNAEGIDNVNGGNMTVQNNYIHDICSNAIYAKGGATDALIENNRIERAYGGGILVGFDTSPEYFDLTVNPQYYENIGGVVRNNLIIDTVLSGIGLYASKDAQVYNNTLVDVDNGPYHSAIYYGITYQDWEEHAGRPANVNPDIHHNIVCQPATFYRSMIEIRYADDLGGLSALDGNPTMDNNCYYVAGGSALFDDSRPGSSRPGNTLEGAGLAAWQSHIGGESESLEVDPELDTDYLATNPQCAGMGLNIPLTVS